VIKNISIRTGMNKNILITAIRHVKERILLDGEARDEVLSLLGDLLNFPAPGTPIAPLAPLPAAGGKQCIALCLGHGRSGDEGADSINKTSEEEYNHPLLGQIQRELMRRGHDVIVISYYEGNGYTTAMTWLAKTLIARGATAAIEFHFNSGTGRSRGHEFLHWSESRKGVLLARALLAAFDRAFPEHPSRGLKMRGAKDRGALFLSLTHCPACIAEPFFGDNRDEWDLFSSDEGIERLVTAYVSGIEAWIQSQPKP
jgi:N-acetylmuramoyl-L-alanine amidase